MKLIYILEKFPSPTEYFILNEILQFERNGFEIILLVLKRQKQYEYLPELKQLKAIIHYLPRLHFYFPIIPFFRSPFSLFHFPPSSLLYSISRLLTSILYLLKTFRYYGISQYFANKKIKCDHIHAHFAFIAVDIANYLSKLLEVNYSLSAHAQDIYTNQGKIKQHLPHAQFLTTCTEYNKTYINKITTNVFIDKTYRVYHGVHLEKWPQVSFRKVNKNGINILSIGRLVEKKGLIYLIQAVERLLKEGIKLRCTIIGEGALQYALEKYIHVNKLHNFIDIIPFVPQHKLVTYYAQADVFVLPCIVGINGDRDGLPNVIVEAMLSEVPVISTPVSAIPEVIQHKETGILVKEKDETVIAEGIRLVVENTDLRNSITKNARRLIEDKLDIRTSTKELIEIFSKQIS